MTLSSTRRHHIVGCRGEDVPGHVVAASFRSSSQTGSNCCLCSFDIRSLGSEGRPIVGCPRASHDGWLRMMFDRHGVPAQGLSVTLVIA